MATSKLVVRKNGIPVKRFWAEKATAKTRESHVTTYPIYFTASHSPTPGDAHKVWSLTDEKAPRTLEEAITTARVMVESSEVPHDHARIYELRLVHRVGTEYDWNRHTQEQKAAHAEAQADPSKRFRLISTTSGV
jgi:hypothetical protein